MDSGDLLGVAILTKSEDDVRRMIGKPGFRRLSLNQVLRSGGHTPLALATSAGRLGMVKLLIEAGADPLAYCDGDNCIHVAARYGHPKIVLELIRRGISVEVSTLDQRRPLFIAAQQSSVETVQVLIEAGADIEFRHEGFFTALFMAAQSGRTGVAIELIKSGAYMGPQGRHSWTPLMQSAHRGYLEIAEALLEHQCPPDSRNEQGCTALHLAASANQTGLMKLLLDYGANRDLETVEGATPLQWAVQESHMEAAVLLTTYRPSAVRRPPDSLHLCVLRNDLGGARDLLDKGAPPDHADRDGVTPLQSAVLIASPRMVEVMLRGGADESAALPAARAGGKAGVTPLALSSARLSGRRQECADARVARARVRVRDALLRVGAVRAECWRWPKLLEVLPAASGEGMATRSALSSAGKAVKGKKGVGSGDGLGASLGRGRIPGVGLVRLGNRDRSKRAALMTTTALNRYVSRSVCKQDLEG
ncbi:unnamed protein product [Ectocarpus sp. 12 AP-2014]